MRTLQERICMVKLFIKYESVTEVRRKWVQHFDTLPPDRNTILSVNRKFEETGSVEDAPRSGRPVSVLTEEKLEEIKESRERSPQRSTTRGSAEHGISRTSYLRAMDKLDLKCFHPQSVVQLNDDDCDRRAEFCETWLAKFENEPKLVDKILWSDEAEFKLHGTINRHNCTYWCQENPHVQIEVSNDRRGIMVWCGMTSNGLLGPYFYEENVNQFSYLNMLQGFVWPKIKHKRLYFQQDGAAAHYAITVRE
jgi:hypothetical protein